MLTKALWLLLFVSTSTFANPLHVDGTTFRDAEGHHVILRGVNVSGSSKVPPFRAIQNREDFAPLNGWGFNSIRLLFNWEAYQPTRTLYDESYMEYYLDVIRWAADYNLYVIVDIHQDAYSRYSAGGCGDGFPLWTLPPDVAPVEPKNDERCKSWGLTAALDPTMHKSWDAFYANVGGTRDEYLTLVRRLAQAMRSEPNVVGIDLMNEPWGDEETQLFELYRDATAVVKEESPEAIVFLSGSSLTSTGLIASKLPRIPGRNIVHQTHYYDPGIPGGKWSPWTLAISSLLWKQLTKEWDAPLYLGEFGAPLSLENPKSYTDAIYDLLDRELYSSAHWVYTPMWNEATKDGWNTEDFSINNAAGELRGTYEPRPWVESLSGDLQTVRWDPAHLSLTLRYQARDPNVSFTIKVPNGYLWASSDNTNLSCQPLEFNRLRCHTNQWWTGFSVTDTLTFTR